MYTVITASKDQIDKLFVKHLKPTLGIIPTVVKSSYTYDDEDDIGFVKLHTITGKCIQYQLRNGKPLFVGFTGFGSVRYDVHYPERSHTEMFELLKTLGEKAEKAFWKGAEI